jgi:Skp family chaperone for outer membrane proteins
MAHKSLIRSRLLLAGAMLGLMATPAAAQTTPTPAPPTTTVTPPAAAPKIAVVEFQRLLKGSQAVIELEKEGRAHQVNLRKEVDAEMKKLRQDALNLQRQQGTLTVTQYQRREANLLRRRNNVELSARARVNSLNQARANALRTLQDEVVKIVKAISVEQGFTLVLLDQGNVLHHAPQYDITDDVLTRLNKSMPKLQLEADPKKPAPKQ